MNLVTIPASLCLCMYLIGSPYSSHFSFSSLQGNMGNDLACLKKLLLAFASSSTMRSWRWGVLLCTVGLVATEPELGSTSISSSLSSDNSTSLNQDHQHNINIIRIETQEGELHAPPSPKPAGRELRRSPSLATSYESMFPTPSPKTRGKLVHAILHVGLTYYYTNQ